MPDRWDDVNTRPARIYFEDRSDRRWPLWLALGLLLGGAGAGLWFWRW